MSLTNELLQNYYNDKDLFSVNLAMTFMRRLNYNIDLIKIINYYYYKNKKKYQYKDIKHLSNLIIDIGNIIINEDFKLELYESLLCFSDYDLKIIVAIIVEILNHMNINNITYNIHSDLMIRSKDKYKIRYILILYHSGRLVVNNSHRISSRNQIVTFSFKSLARI